MKVRKLINIIGIIQDIGFRSSLVDEAKRLGITGKLIPLPSGHIKLLVEGEIEGEEENIEHLIEWIKNNKGDKIEKIETVSEPFKGNLIDFIVVVPEHLGPGG